MPQSVKSYPTPVFAAGIAIGGAALAVAGIAGPALIIADIIWLAAVLIAGLIDRKLLLSAAKNIRVVRMDSDSFVLAEEKEVLLHAGNHSGFPMKLQIKDTPPQSLRSDHPLFRLTLQPGETSELKYTVLPSLRGHFSFGNLWSRLTTGLRLFAVHIQIPSSASFTVRPNTNLERQSSLLTRLDRRAIGFRSNRLRGIGQEFQSLRDWAPEDGIRPVDWKASARKAKLISREYEVERSQNVVIMVDLGRSMATLVKEGNLAMPVSKVDYAVGAATLLSWVCTQSRDNIGLIGFESEVQAFMAPGKGAKHFRQIQQCLSELEAKLVEPAYRMVFNRVHETIKRRSLVIVMTDITDGVTAEILAAQLERLRSRHLALVLAVTDHELGRVLAKKPDTLQEIYSQAVAENMMEDRRATISKLRSRGVMAMDVNPRDLNVSLVNAYLDIKRQGLL